MLLRALLLPFIIYSHKIYDVGTVVIYSHFTGKETFFREVRCLVQGLTLSKCRPGTGISAHQTPTFLVIAKQPS